SLELTHRTGYKPKLMIEKPQTKTAVVMITSDKGLAGSFNANVFRHFEKKIKPKINKDEVFVFIAVGKKAEEYLLREKLEIVQSFKNFGDHASIETLKPLTNLLIEKFLSGEWSNILTISTYFRTTLRQYVLIHKILPIKFRNVLEVIQEIVPEYGRFSNLKDLEKEILGAQTQFGDYEYLVEPDPQTVLDELAPRLVEIQLYAQVLESNASEHSTRMIAMKNASENTKEIKENLTIEFNKFRQGNITREISEIVSGAESLN
ncbi:ATP synthase F1 subunit gamma, partial [Candidatus Azambacteria bacterium]|nr:ATP synthase F1 subunit gamma [Candidatus Azambacteria bacterium]